MPEPSDRPMLDAMPDSGAPSLAGRRIGDYTIERAIGRGAAATVYRAHDAKHRRPVALKVLHGGQLSETAYRRFQQEIQVVAGLHHPHILPLFDSGVVDGCPYFVTPLVESGTLRDRLARDGPLPIPEVRRIVAQIASGLDHAHRRGIVHRDVKPGNVLLDDGQVAIADFGVARLSMPGDGETLTREGEFVGTPTYTSPEQLSGEGPPGPGADLYAVGCMAFEMLTGAPPFRAATLTSIIAQHLLEPVPSARARRSELPPGADEVLRRAMAKDPADRHASVAEFARELEVALADGVAAKRRLAVPRPPGALVGIALAVLAAGFVTVAVTLARRGREPPSIAVLPFVNMSGDPSDEYFSDGVTEELTGALAQLGRLEVAPRTTAFAYKGRAGDIRRIGRELGVSRILEGSVRRDDDSVHFVAALYDTRSGDRLWGPRRFVRPWGSVLALQSEIAATIAGQLRADLLPADQARLARRHPVSAEAYDSYLQGRYHFDRRTAASLEQALVHFRRAIAIDPTYARAHAGLADTYSILAWRGAAAPRTLLPLAERSARHALTLDSTVAEAHVALAIVHTFHAWDWASAARASAYAIALDSTLTNAWFFRTWHLAAEGRLDEAMRSLERARELDPGAPIIIGRIGSLHTWSGRHATADSLYARALAIDPGQPAIRVKRALLLSTLGRHDEAVAMLPPDSVRLGSYEAGIPGYVYARAGHRERALASARALESRAYVPEEGMAAIYLGLGDTSAALSWLDRAYEARAVGLPLVWVEPLFAGLRRQPRFQRLVARIGAGRAGPGAVSPGPVSP